MRKVIGYWSGGINRNLEVGIEDGVLFVKEVPWTYGYTQYLRFKKDFGKTFFGDINFLVGLKPEFVMQVLQECNGKTEAGAMEVAEKYRARREERRNREYLEQKKWEELRNRFSGIVLGIDKKIDVYETGFSVRVVFTSEISFKDKARFLRENRVEFACWVMSEINDSKKICDRIGSIKFYRPVEIVNLRAQEVEVKFEVKEGAK